MQVRDVALQFKQYALHERGMRPKSYRSIMATVEMLCRWADTDDLKRLDNGTARAFLYWGREEKAWEARTFRNHRQYLQSFFIWCCDRGWIKANPIDGIEKPKLPQHLLRCLNRDEAQTILAQVRWYPWRYQFEAVRNETILYFFVYTGLRVQELANLEMPDVHIDCQELVVRQGKGQKDRIIPIHPRLVPILRHYLAEREARGNHSSYFFTGVKSEKPLAPKNVQHMCQRLSRNCGVYFTPHMLRHTFGRLMVEANVDLFKIKEMMGHASVATTQIYLSVSTDNLKRTMGEVELL